MATRLDSYHLFEKEWGSYDQLCEAFEWEIPDSFNITEYTCDRWATDRGRVAFFAESPDGDQRTLTFRDVQIAVNQLANFLSDAGISAGDRVGVSVGQRPEAAIAHLAAWKLKAISVPLSTEFGPDALAYRLADCGATACVVGTKSIEPLRSIRDELDALETVLTVGTDPAPSETSWDSLTEQPRRFETPTTDPETDALIIYTSGTTGEPKGVLHAHRVVLGHLSRRMSIYVNSDVDITERVTWTPVEWSWIGSLVAGVLPTLFYGQPIVGYDADRFDPEKAFEIIERYGVTDMGGPTTVFRMMMQVENPAERYDLEATAQIGMGGEDVGRSVVEWAETTFDATVVEAYGQTEADHVIGDCPGLKEPKVGKMGVELPGHDVTLVDPQSGEATIDTGETGEIAVRYDGNPVCFKEYWNKPDRTKQKVQNGWLLTEDLGSIDDGGYFSFEGRKDDVILTSGYRVSPGEIEESLASHEAIADAGVIGIPDDERGRVPKAFVVPVDGINQDEDLKRELQTRIKDQLAPYEYPREIEFIETLPKTSTGKVRRATLRDRE